MKKWRNIELNKKEGKIFSEYLKAIAIKYEKSCIYQDLFHFEILTSDEEVKIIDNFLMKL